MTCFSAIGKMEKNNVEEGGCPGRVEDVGRGKQCEGCPGQAMCQGMTKQGNRPLEIRMKAIGKKWMILSGKGGVGKSTFTSLLAILLKLHGKKVSILDVDLCGPSIPILLPVDDRTISSQPHGWILPTDSAYRIPILSIDFLVPGAQAVIWRGPKKSSFIQSCLQQAYWGKLDALLIDTPPGTSDEHLSVVSSLAKCGLDGAILVTTSQQVALLDMKKEVTFCRKVGIPILGIVENMVGYECPCCHEITHIFHTVGVVADYAAAMGIPYLGKLPICPNLSSQPAIQLDVDTTLYSRLVGIGEALKII